MIPTALGCTLKGQIVLIFTPGARREKNIPSAANNSMLTQFVTLYSNLDIKNIIFLPSGTTAFNWKVRRKISIRITAQLCQLFNWWLILMWFCSIERHCFDRSILLTRSLMKLWKALINGWDSIVCVTGLSIKFNKGIKSSIVDDVWTNSTTAKANWTLMHTTTAGDFRSNAAGLQLRCARVEELRGRQDKGLQKFIIKKFIFLSLSNLIRNSSRVH